MDKIVGRNLRRMRTISEFTQDDVATALDITRSAYSNYESGEREMPLNLMEKVADLFGCELYLFFEENPSEDMILTTAFRIKGASHDDLQEIMHFKEIVKSYIKMELLEITP
jgi:transcriptional regulator with XRE-family HTH domain